MEYSERNMGSQNYDMVIFSEAKLNYKYDDKMCNSKFTDKLISIVLPCHVYCVKNSLKLMDNIK